MKERISVLRNAAISSVGTYFEYVLGLIVSIWIARSLGPKSFGEYAFDIWLCGWMIIACNHALTMSSIRFIAEARGSGDENVASGISALMLRLQGWSSLVVIVGFVAIALCFPPSDWSSSPVLIIAFIAAAVVAKSGFTMRVSIAKGYELFAPEAIAAVATGVISVALVTIWSELDGGATGYLGIFAVLSLLMNLIIRVTLRRRGVKIDFSPLTPELRARIRRHLWLTGAFVVLYSMTNRTIETFLLKLTGTSEELGFFAISATLTKGAVDFLSSGLSATLLPAMARAYGRRSSSLLTIMLPDAIRFFWFLGVAIAGLGYVVTPSLVSLMFGAKYLPAVTAVQISLVVAGLTLLVAPINAYQTIADQQADRIRITVGTLFANALAGVLLIGRFGLEGALATLAVSRGVNVMLAVGFVRFRTGVRMPARAMIRIAFAAGAACIAGLLVNAIILARWQFIASGFAFTAVYLSLSIVLRCWKSEDYALAGSLLNRLPRGAALAKGLASLSRNFSDQNG